MVVALAWIGSSFRSIEIRESAAQAIDVQFQNYLQLSHLKLITFHAFFIRCSDAYSDTMLGYANSIRTIDGGTHIDGMKAALTRTLNNLGKKSKIIKVHLSYFQNLCAYQNFLIPLLKA